MEKIDFKNYLKKNKLHFTQIQGERFGNNFIKQQIKIDNNDDDLQRKMVWAKGLPVLDDDDDDEDVTLPWD